MGKALLSIAVLPTFVIFAIVIKNARAAKEPFRKVAKVFFLSVASTIAAIILEEIGDNLMEILFSSMGQDYKTVMGMLFQTIFVIAMVEEGCKYFSFKLMIFHDRACTHAQAYSWATISAYQSTRNTMTLNTTKTLSGVPIS